MKEKAERGASIAELTRLQQDIINFYHQNPFTEYIQLMTRADTACGAACLAKNKRVVTISLGMDFMHSIPLTTKIIAIGRVLHDGRHTMTCESEIRDENGKLYAKGHGTFYVLGLFDEELEEGEEGDA